MRNAVRIFFLKVFTMVVEHVFVTTMESREALTAASNLLQSFGFQVKNNNAFQMGGWSDLEVSRGRPNSARAKDITQCFQQVRLEFDRGRVTLAASISPLQNSNRSFRLHLWGYRTANNVADLPAKKQRQYSDLMLTIANALESLLALRTSPEIVSEAWGNYENQIRAEAQKTRRRSTIIWLSILGVILAMVALIVVMSRR